MGDSNLDDNMVVVKVEGKLGTIGNFISNKRSPKIKAVRNVDAIAVVVVDIVKYVWKTEEIVEAFMEVVVAPATLGINDKTKEPGIGKRIKIMIL